MKKWDAVIKESRNCHTKEAWDSFFQKYNLLISTSNTSKPLDDLFKMLKKDPQALQYDPTISATLIKGCLSCWNLELGKEICLFYKSISSPEFTITAAQLFLECGEPHFSRDICQKSLRVQSLSETHRLQFQVLICGSYAEEGMIKRASRLAGRLSTSIKLANLSAKDEADLKAQLGRMYFFLGEYQKASELFREISFKYLNLEYWESASRALFNTAASSQNAGQSPREHSYNFVEESRLLAEKHNLKGPLSHCEAFYGLDSYNHGNFSKARDHFRKALLFLPVADKSYRRLHIISMLTLSYLALGKYKLAKKFGQQTMRLAAKDHSSRYHSRYKSLEAELLWEEGKLEDSQTMLQKVIENFHHQGIHTLEDFSSYSRYLLQASILGQKIFNTKIIICTSLHKHTFTYLGYLYAQGQILLNINDYITAFEKFHEVLDLANEHDDIYHISKAYLGLIQCKLSQSIIDTKLSQYINEFKINVRKMGETPLKAQLDIINAAFAYQTGDFKKCYRILKASSRYSHMSYTDNYVIKSWIATIQGRSFRPNKDWQKNLISRYTKIYFSPNLKVINNENYLISRHYKVNLNRHPALADLLTYLINKPKFLATMDEIQKQVWKESTNTQGWKQKIRNSITRLRTIFPYTVAPLILHQEDVSIFNDAIKILPLKKVGVEREHEVYQLLTNTIMTSSQLSDRISVSKATTKRILHNLVSKDKIKTIKKGRHVYYAPLNNSG